MAEEIDVEKCNLQKLTVSDLDLDLNLGSGHVISACAIHIGLPACPTM